MTKIAFVAHRANYLKHYGPVIDAALGRGWNVECWIQQGKDEGGKTYLKITPQMFTTIWGDKLDVLEFDEPSTVVDLAKQRRPDVIISLHPRSAYGYGDGAQFITLQHSVDTFVKATPTELASSDQLCLFTPFWLEYADQYYELVDIAQPGETERKLRDKIAFTGFAQMDAFAKIDKAEVRSRWGIEADRPVVVVLPVDLVGWPGAWPQFFAAPSGRKQVKAFINGARRDGLGFAAKYAAWAARGWNDEALAESLKRFCGRNDAFMLIKGREKDPLRRAWQERADKAFYDETQYPATIFEAISISNLCVFFYSTAAQEAAYAGVPSICVDRPNKEIAKHMLWRSNKRGGPYNYPGVIDWMALPAAINHLSHQDLAMFELDEDARKKYLATYNGIADHKASERILNLVN